MDSQLKQRLIGAAVLVALAVIFLPMLLKGPDIKEPDAAQVPLSMPATPGQDYETRELPLVEPEAGSPKGGVLGMTPAEPAALPVDTAPLVSDASVADARPSTVATVATAAPAAVAPPPTPAAVAAGQYMVNIGSFSNVANANALVDKLRAQKLPVVADKVALAHGTGMRVRVGPYADRATAEAARLRAEEITDAAGKVVATDASAAELAARAPAPATKPEAAKPAPGPSDAAKPTAAAVPKAAATPPPAPAPKAASAAGVGFAVQLSAPSVEADANALRDKARAQGLSAFVQPVETDSGRRYRVRLGPVADRASAQSLSEEAAAKLGNKGIIVSNP
jgi:DedD protein